MVSIADIDNMISAGELAVAIAMRKSTKKKTARMDVERAAAAIRKSTKKKTARMSVDELAVAMRKSTKKKTARMSVDVELKLIQMFTGSTIGSRY